MSTDMVPDSYWTWLFAQEKENQSVAITRKFNVSRTDGRDAPGGDREDARYFVVDVTHDPFAPHMLHMYAGHLRLTGNPEDRADAHVLQDLADDMLADQKRQAEIARASTL